MTADAVREAVGVETIGIGLGGVELARTWFESICSLYAEVFSVLSKVYWEHFPTIREFNKKHETEYDSAKHR